jgi:glycosyltransferase involved in cell wall biosynthesis
MDIQKPRLNQIAGCFPAVLVIGNGFTGGGAEARLSRLVKHLFSGQVDVALVSGNGPLNELTNGEIFYLLWKSRFSYPRLTWNLRRILQKREYDAVIAFGLFPIAISSLAIMGMTNRPKLIMSEITRPIAEVRMQSGMRRLIYSYLQKLLYRRGDLITANSIDGLVETCQVIGANPKFGVRLPNIVDSEQIKKNANREAPCSIRHGRYLICVGRLDFMKRMDTVVDAFGLLEGRSRCGLVIVGDGEERQALEAQVKALGLEKSVTFTGRLENPFPLMRGASAFVLASEFEGFSNSVLEAMFCDVPVITSFCSTDAREMCDQGAALGFEVGDTLQLSRHISAVVDDESVGRKLVSRAREYRARHEVNQAIPVYEGVIRSVVEHTV